MALSLHSEALCWLRYAKRMPLVCTEMGLYNADVFGLSADTSIEVEIKKSRADLQAEFRAKPRKHFMYANADELKSGNTMIPNFFYVFVPQELADYARDFVAEKAPKAGVIALMQPTRGKRVSRHQVRSVRPAQRLHEYKPGVRLLRTVAMRMASEICISRIALDALKLDGLGGLEQAIVGMAWNDSYPYEEGEGLKMEKVK